MEKPSIIKLKTAFQVAFPQLAVWRPTSAAEMSRR